MTLERTGELPAVDATVTETVAEPGAPLLPQEAFGAMDPRERASFTDVFSCALRGDGCTVVDEHGGEVHLPVTRWRSTADPDDHLLLDACDGPTIDIGCGPGRMSAALHCRGTSVLGVDVVAEAVAQTRARGVPALLRDVFEPVPGEGSWGTALLADGNIGINGDPVSLLSRARELVRPGGRVVVDLEPPGHGVSVAWTRLRCCGAESKPFRWARVCAEAVHAVAAEAGLRVRHTGWTDHRWYAVLQSPASAGA